MNRTTPGGSPGGHPDREAELRRYEVYQREAYRELVRHWTDGVLESRRRALATVPPDDSLRSATLRAERQAVLDEIKRRMQP